MATRASSDLLSAVFVMSSHSATSLASLSTDCRRLGMGALLRAGKGNSEDEYDSIVLIS